MRNSRIRVPTIALLIYVAGMTAYVYAFEHRADADRAREEGFDEVVVLSAAALLHVALGAAGRWPMLFAVFLPVLLAIPAGGYPGGWPEMSVALSMLLQELLYGLPLVAVGALARWLFDRSRR